jgi:hypothetical protein
MTIQQQKSLSELILQIAPFTPHEFQRRLRPLHEFPHYKASEFRSLLLYFGPFLLKSYLPKQYFEHFLLLHFGIYIFVSDKLTHLRVHAGRCIDIFVNEFPNLYGVQSQSYNVHVMKHLFYFYF